MTDHDTNGYSTDRKMIEYRLDETDSRLRGVEAAIVNMAGELRELKTTAQGWGRTWGVVAGAASSIVVGVVLYLLTR